MQQSNYQMWEPRHHWIWVGGIGSILMGLMFLGIGWQGFLIGIISIIAGVATLGISRFGSQWNKLQSADRAKVLPGVILGILFIICAIIAYFFLRWFWSRN
jgi:hypothetical protein